MSGNSKLSPITENVRLISHLNLVGGGQIEVQGSFAYVGHMEPPYGTTIIDVSDLRHPKVVSQIMLDGPHSHTHKVRIAGDVMYTNVEQHKRHFLRKGDKIPAIRAGLESQGKEPSDAAVAAVLEVDPTQIPTLDEARERGYRDGGFKLWDVSDRAAPREIAYVRTHGFGTHRFDADERYAYISTEMEGYVGNILVIYDCANPEKPEEISRWWMPGQYVGGGETPTWEGYGNRLHHALRFGDELWAACWQAGFRILDVSDIAKPMTIGEINYHPPVQEPSHTIIPLDERVGGRRLAVGIDEQHASVHGQPPAGMWVFDVTDSQHIQTLSSFNLSELDSPYSRKGGRFGAHQFHEKSLGTLIFATWFSGGLRIVDVADPSNPQEVGFFIPTPVDGQPTPQSNDVYVTNGGTVFLLDRVAGLDILEFRG